MIALQQQQQQRQPQPLTAEDRRRLFATGLMALRPPAPVERKRGGLVKVDVPFAVRDRVVARVAAAFGLEPRRIYFRQRTAPIPQARHVAMAVLFTVHGYTSSAIARAFGRSHSLVMIAVSAVEHRRHNAPLSERRKLEAIFAAAKAESAAA